MELYKSKDYWALMFPMEGFYVNYASIDQNITYTPKCNYDILLACERQRNFYYQVYKRHSNEQHEQQVHSIKLLPPLFLRMIILYSFYDSIPFSDKKYSFFEAQDNCNYM